MRATSKSPTITQQGAARSDDGLSARLALVRRRLPRAAPPTHPGTMLLEEFLIPLGVTQVACAEAMGVSFPRLNGLVNGRRGVTPDTALRLARVVGMTADFWLELQLDWDLWHAVRSDRAAGIEDLPQLGARSDTG